MTQEERQHVEETRKRLGLKRLRGFGPLYETQPKKSWARAILVCLAGVLFLIWWTHV